MRDPNDPLARLGALLDAAGGPYVMDVTNPAEVRLATRGAPEDPSAAGLDYMLGSQVKTGPNRFVSTLRRPPANPTRPREVGPAPTARPRETRRDTAPAAAAPAPRMAASPHGDGGMGPAPGGPAPFARSRPAPRPAPIPADLARMLAPAIYAMDRQRALDMAGPRFAGSPKTPVRPVSRQDADRAASEPNPYLPSFRHKGAMPDFPLGRMEDVAARGAAPALGALAQIVDMLKNRYRPGPDVPIVSQVDALIGKLLGE